MPTQAQRQETLLRLAAQVLINRTKAGSTAVLFDGKRIAVAANLVEASIIARDSRNGITLQETV